MMGLVRRPGIKQYAICLNWFGDVLDPLLAHRLKGERQLPLDLLGHFSRDADAARLRKLLKSGRNIDPFAIAVVAVDDHLAEVDTDPHQHLFGFGNRGVALGQAALQRHCTFDGIDDAAEFGQQPIAHQLEDTAVVTSNFGFEQFLASRTKALERTTLVALHQSRIAYDVCC